MFKNYLLPSVNIKNETIEATKGLIIDAKDLITKINNHGGSEAYYCLYDFEDNKKLTSYRGLHRPALNYVVFDLDSEDLTLSLKEARTLAAYFIAKGYEHSLITPYFSGSKGFHIYIHTSVFGIGIGESEAYKVKKTQEAVSQLLRLTTIDLGIHNTIRKFRLPRSRHPKTGLYKTELTLRELAQLDIEQIKALASTKRPCQLDPYNNTAKKPITFKLPERTPDVMLPAEPLTPFNPTFHFGSENLLECDLPKAYPTDTPCSLAIEQESVPTGLRHLAILLFIQNLYLKGVSRADAEDRVLDALRARGLLKDRSSHAIRMLNDAYSKKQIYKYRCDEHPKKALCKTSCPIYQKQPS